VLLLFRTATQWDILRMRSVNLMEERESWLTPLLSSSCATHWVTHQGVEEQLGAQFG